MTPEIERLERLGERLRAVNPVMPSPAAKIRGWNLVLAEVEKSAASRSRPHSVGRLVLAGLAAVTLFVLGAVAASADSLPDSPLYPIKGAVEDVRGALAFAPSDQFAFHLELARTRLVEAEAMVARHRIDLAVTALSALDDQLNSAATVVRSVRQSDPSLGNGLEAQLRQAVATHDQQLADLQGQVSNPEAISAITRARDRAQQAIQAAAQQQGPPNGKNGNPSPGDKGKGRGGAASGSSAASSQPPSQSP